MTVNFLLSAHLTVTISQSIYISSYYPSGSRSKIIVSAYMVMKLVADVLVNELVNLYIDLHHQIYLTTYTYIRLSTLLIFVDTNLV